MVFLFAIWTFVRNVFESSVWAAGRYCGESFESNQVIVSSLVPGNFNGIHRKQPKIDALRQCKDEILEAHRSGCLSTGSRRFSRNAVLTFPCRIWCGPSCVLSTKESGPQVRGHPLRKARRVLQQRNAVRNRPPLKQRSQGRRLRVRCLNSRLPESRRRNLRSSCGWRDIWLLEARRHRGH
jgi:hypothetical protein